MKILDELETGVKDKTLGWYKSSTDEVTKHFVPEETIAGMIAVCRAAEAWNEQRQSSAKHSYREEMKCVAAIQDALAKLSEVKA